MRVLALDSSTRDGSVAVLDNGRTAVERVGDAARPQAERLPGDLLEALAAAGIGPHDVDLFAIAAGPGSFTGLRIGIAALQGMAMVVGRPMVAVSVLEALGHAAAAGQAPGTVVGAWIDAYRREVFSALYDVTDAPPFAPERLRVIEPARVAPPDAVAADWQARRPALVMGSGAVLYAGALTAFTQVVAPPPLAAVVARVARERARRGEAVSPAAIQPYYVRRPDVEVAREQRR